jgi:hypothetical protein
MAEGKERNRALHEFDEEIGAPMGGWGDANRRLMSAIRTAE